MFPAKQVISIIDHPGAKLISKHCNAPIDKIVSCRTIGLLSQAECITQYAMEIFKEISNDCTKLFQRVDNLSQKTAAVEKSFNKYIENYKSIAKSQNHGIFSEMNDQNKIQPPEYQFTLQIPNFVDTMVQAAKPSPNFSPFEEIVHQIPGKESISYEKMFSDPNFFAQQYKQELQRQIEKEREVKRAAQSEMKQREKEEKRLNAENKKAHSKKIQQEQMVVAEQTIDIYVPPSLQRPPKKGNITHSKAISIKHKVETGTQTEDYLQSSATTKLTRTDSNEKYSLFTKQMSESKEAERKMQIEQEEQRKAQYSEQKPIQTPQPPKSPIIPQNIPPPPPPPSSLNIPPPLNVPPPPNLPPPPTSKTTDVSKAETSQAAAPGKELTHLDLIKAGNFKLKHVENTNTQLPKPQQTPPLSHLDLIKAGNFKLRHVDRTEKTAVKEVRKDPDSLSIQELLQKAATIRDAVQCSDSDNEEEEESLSSELW